VVAGGLTGTGEPRRGGRVVVLDERGELAPAVLTLEQHALAHRDAAEAGGHRDRPDVDPHRASSARSRSASRSVLPLASSGRCGSTTSWRGAQARGWASATQSRASSREIPPSTNAT